MDREKQCIKSMVENRVSTKESGKEIKRMGME